MYGSVAQVGHDAQPAFCIVFAVVVQRVAERLAVLPLRLRLYMDDVAVQCNRESMQTVRQTLFEEMDRVHCSVQPSKSACHVPAVTSEVKEESLPELQRLASAVQVRTACK